MPDLALVQDAVLAPDDISGGIQSDAAVEQELQPVPSMSVEPEVKPKVLGEFDDDTAAKLELERLRNFRDAVSKDQDVQRLVQQRQEAVRQAEVAKLSIQAEEQRLLEAYASAVAQGNPDKALLTLVREIRGQAQQDAQVAIRRELDTVTEPIRAKSQLLESAAWKDLHPVADEATWLATEMGKLGYTKPQVADFMRRVGQKYSQVSEPQQIVSRKRNVGWSGESPDSGGYNEPDDKNWDKQIDNYWKSKGL